MSKKAIYPLSEYKINKNDPEMKKRINDFYEYQKKGEYYFALYCLEDLLLQDGTSKKYNAIFLNFILDNFEDLMNDINQKKKEKKRSFMLYKANSRYLNDVYLYNFYYLRNCFDKFEIALDMDELKIIQKKKMNHNLKVINQNKFLKFEYCEFINSILSEEKFISADEIYKTINSFNNQIKNANYKLFYLYKYLDCKLIENNKIFKYLEKNIFYLNQFYFANFDDLGIPIECSDNQNLIYRYLFMLIKNKINKNKEIIEMSNDAMTFIFKIFKNIFYNIKQNKYEYVKYFVFNFVYIIFESDFGIINMYLKDFKNINFEIICNQFLANEEINIKLVSKFIKKGLNVTIDKYQATINIQNENIIIDNKNYSLKSFLKYLKMYGGITNLDIIKNNSRKLICQDQIYNKYHNDYISLLKKICISNIAETMQSLHEEFKEYETFYKNDYLLNDLFQNKLKFYPFDRCAAYGITDKYLLEIYLSSKYQLDFGKNNNFAKNPEIVIIFNMSLNCVIFQHESLNHFIRAYLFYNYDSKKNNRKISINTKKNYNYYPKQNLNKIKEDPKYLKKFQKELSDNELKQLKEKSDFDYKKYLENYNENKMEIEEDDISEGNINLGIEENDPNEDDEGFYYERQLFTAKNEQKLKKFNFLQALMLIDEDAYNLDPISFHYCFLRLVNTKEFEIYKKNFNSKLLKALLENINAKQKNEIKNLSLNSKRGFKYNEFIELERTANDVMSSYFSNNS